MILADTGVWIDYFRGGNDAMRILLESRQIAIHPYVAAELSLGSLRDRGRTLTELDELPKVRTAQLAELRLMIENFALYARGISFVDVHLLASCLLTPSAQLWTRDASLRRAALSLGVAADFN